MANPSTSQTAITFQFKASLGSVDLPSEDVVWMLILTFCSTLACDSTFPSAGFTGPMESSKTELCQTPGAGHHSGQCTKGREGVTACSGSIEFHMRKFPRENSAPGLCWSSDTARGHCRSSEGSEGFELQGRGCSHLCSCCELSPRENSHSSHGRHTQPWSPSCSALALPLIPGQSRPGLPGQPRVPAAPRALLHLTTQHNTGALTSNSFSSNVFSRCCGITSLNPFWSARN